MDGYLREIKVIADSLAAIQCPMSNQDLVQYTLFGLDRDPDYDHIVTTLLHYPFPISFDDLRHKLLLHEQRLINSKDASDSSSHHALLAVKSTGTGSSSSSHTNSGGRNRGRNNRNRGGTNNRGGNNARGNNGGNGGNNNNRGSGGNNNNGNRGRSNGISKFSNLSSYSMPCLDYITNNLSSAGSNSSNSNNVTSTPTSDTCGLCWFPGHQAAYCPQRFNHNFVPSSSESVTRALAALSVGGESNDSVWYPDSGAASHMTPQDGPDNGGNFASRNQ
ncbi:uncharacterized protein LOC130591941 [Beta vulgaris subsp. vulgaris]|uniref:uncharacterized protein LOC130591941 n=1 Tax=Beta vulgaris subsp. vulgaris TaxID=3555 RepID=UPI002546DFB8|nr:uncharacterized protein LOC130591941 [Beta vulgaris subsp. vulgaris]